MYFWGYLIMLKQNLQQKLLQKLSPQQIQFIKLLQVPTVSLDTRIKEELEENPALEDLSLTNLNEPEEQYPDHDPDEDNYNGDEEKGEVDEFNIAYDELLKNNSGDYKKVNLKNVIDMDFKAFFRDGKYKVTRYPNIQIFDEAGVIGRAFSSSYVPAEGTEDGDEFLVKLRDIFDRYNNAGIVRFQYETEIYSGKF